MSSFTFPFSGSQITCIKRTWTGLQIIEVNHAVPAAAKPPSHGKPTLRASWSMSSLRASSGAAGPGLVVKHLPNLPTFQYQVCSTLSHLEYEPIASPLSRNVYSLQTLDPSHFESLIAKYQLDQVLEFIAIAVYYLELRLPVPDIYVDYLSGNRRVREWSGTQYDVFAQAVLQTVQFTSSDDQAVFHRFLSHILTFVMGQTMGSVLERLPSPTVEPAPTSEPAPSAVVRSPSSSSLASHEFSDYSLFSGAAPETASVTTNETIQPAVQPVDRERGLLRRMARSLHFSKRSTDPAPQEPLSSSAASTTTNDTSRSSGAGSASSSSSPDTPGTSASRSMARMFLSISREGEVSLAFSNLSRATTISQSTIAASATTTTDAPPAAPAAKPSAPSPSFKSSSSLTHRVMLDGSLMVYRERPKPRPVQHARPSQPVTGIRRALNPSSQALQNRIDISESQDCVII